MRSLLEWRERACHSRVPFVMNDLTDRPLVLATLALLAIASCRKHEPVAIRTECILAEPETRALYDRLTPALRGTDCTFVGLRTDHDHMLITLSDGRDSIPAITVAHSGCAVQAISVGARYGAVIPGSASSRCPIAVSRIRSTLDTGDAH